MIENPVTPGTDANISCKLIGYWRTVNPYCIIQTGCKGPGRNQNKKVLSTAKRMNTLYGSMQTRGLEIQKKKERTGSSGGGVNHLA